MCDVNELAHKPPLELLLDHASENGSETPGKPTPVSYKSSGLELYFGKRVKAPVQHLQQMGLCGNTIDPGAGHQLSIAIADFIHSHLLPFSIADDPKLMKIIDEARNLGGSFVSPHQRKIADPLLDALYETNWKEQLKTITSELRIFGVKICGDGATLKSVLLVNVLAAGVNNPFA